MMILIKKLLIKKHCLHFFPSSGYIGRLQPELQSVILPNVLDVFF